MAIEQITTKLPDLSGVGDILVYIIGGIVFAILLAVGVGIAYYYYSFNQRIELFRKVAGYPRRIGVDHGRFVRISSAGDYILFTRKNKKWLPRPQNESAPRTWWFFVREDGEWINFVLSDLDEQMKQAGAFYIDNDMRMSRIAIEKILKDRLQSKNWWQEHMGTMVGVMFIVIVTVCLIILFRELPTVASAMTDMSSSVKEMAQAVHNMAGSTGSGVIPK